MGNQSRWCNGCKATHAGRCPNQTPWVKPVFHKSGRGGRPWRRKREYVFKRDSFCCQECLRKGVVTIVTISGSLAGICDHIVPLAEGGFDDESNLQTLCQKCSKEKTDQESKRGRGGLKP